MRVLLFHLPLIGSLLIAGFISVSRFARR